MTEAEPQTPLIIDATENLTAQLATARALLTALAEMNDPGVELREPAERLARLVLELSDWIEHGGSLPDQWQRGSGDDLDDDDADPTIADLDGRFGPGPDAADDA